MALVRISDSTQQRRINLNEAQEQIHKFAGGIKRPDWASRQPTYKGGDSVTRENWIWAAYLGDEPKEWSQELEDELPEHLRLDEQALHNWMRDREEE